IGHATVYSKVLGSIDQNFMQGMLTTIVNLVMVPVTLIAKYVFEQLGPTIWWVTVVVVMIGGIVLWLSTMRRMENYIGDVRMSDAVDTIIENEMDIPLIEDTTTGKLSTFDNRTKIYNHQTQLNHNVGRKHKNITLRCKHQ
ncbi:hypothetical protein PENTCL1PPCAC_4900, partial [Pristionchus entomophagus]